MLLSHPQQILLHVLHFHLHSNLTLKSHPESGTWKVNSRCNTATDLRLLFGWVLFVCEICLFIFPDSFFLLFSKAAIPLRKIRPLCLSAPHVPSLSLPSRTTVYPSRDYAPNPCTTLLRTKKRLRLQNVLEPHSPAESHNRHLRVLKYFVQFEHNARSEFPFRRAVRSESETNYVIEGTSLSDILRNAVSACSALFGWVSASPYQH